MIISSANEQRVVDYVVSRYRELKDARKVKEEVWMECVRAYLSDFSTVWDTRAKKEGRSARYIPLSFDAVETLHSQITAITMPGNHWIGMSASTPGKLKYDDEAADELKALLYQQIGRMGFARQYDILVKQLAIVGNAPYTVGWRKERVIDYPAFEAGMAQWEILHKKSWEEYSVAMEEWQRIARIAEASGQQAPPPPSLVAPEPPPADAKKIAYSGPSIEVGDIFNFVVDPFPTDNSHRLCIKRSWMSKAAMLRMAEKNAFGYSVYDNVDNVTPRERRTARDESHLNESYLAFGLQVPEAQQVDVLEAWGTMEIPGGSLDGRSTFVGFCACVANESTLVRFEPTFLWSGETPVRLATYRDVPGQVYGIGALEPALGLADLANVRANQNVDVVSFALSPEYKAVDDGIIAKTLKSAPAKVHMVGDINNLVPIEKNLTGLQLSMQDLVLLKNEFKMVTKSGSPLSGDSRESATKTKTDSMVLGTDIGKVAEHIETTVLREIVDLFVQLNCQYITKPEAARSLQKGQASFVLVSPESIRRGWVISVNGTRYATDKQERAQNLLMFQQLVTGNPMILPVVNLLNLIKKVYEELGFSDSDEIFNDEARADQILSEMIRFGMLGSGGAQGQTPEVSDASMAAIGG